MDIVKLIGADVLPDSQRLTLEISKVIKIGFIQQNAYHEIDTYSSLEKQSKLMEIILYLYEKCKELLEMQIPMKTLKDSGIFEDIIPMKYSIADNELHKFDEYMNIIDNFYSNILNNNTGGEHF
jgi:V/A-type H+-transporting ATPase subunit A